MNKPISLNSKVTKVLVWNKVENEQGYDNTICEVVFDNGSKISYECADIEELEDENMGIYKLLEDGSYEQVEDWES